MAKLTRDDGVEIHWEQRGDGPAVVLSSYFNCHPSAYANLIGELTRDHRVVRYDARGMGRSTRAGPYDIETSTGDLEAVAEAAGGDAVSVAPADGCNVATRAADRSPELIRAVVGLGGAPLSLQTMRDTDALVSSGTVIDAFIETLENSYRIGMRPLITATNPQMSEKELQQRVDEQVEYCPQEAGVGRVRAWRDDDSTPAAHRIGDRLIILYSAQVAGPWLPEAGQMSEVFSRLLPEARLIEIEDGMVSRPDLTAAVVRELTAARQSAS